MKRAPKERGSILHAKLRALARGKELVGFCKWKDGDGLLFGRVLSVKGDRVRFGLVHPDGSFDEEVEYSVREITRLVESKKYVERLELFALFLPSVFTQKGSAVRGSAKIHACLVEAKRSGECVSLTLRGDSRRDFRVTAADGDLFAVDELTDDPRIVEDKKIVRLNQIEKLEWRSTAQALVTAVWKTRGTKARRKK